MIISNMYFGFIKYPSLKVSKLLHGVSMTSFSQKFAVDRGLPSKKEEFEQIGKLLEKVLR